MADLSTETARKGPRQLVQRLRLYSGLVLMVYVTSHLANHMAGLWSLEALEASRLWFVAVWRSGPMTVLLYGALAIHMVLAAGSIVLREKLSGLPVLQQLQYVLGLLGPWLLLAHVVGTRGQHQLFGIDDTYTYVLLGLWHDMWSGAAMQAVALVVVWTHGCIGVHQWLRYSAFYRRSRAWWFAAALLVPALSLAGYVAAGARVMQFAANPEWLAAAEASFNLPGRGTDIDPEGRVIAVATGYLVLLAALVGVRWLVLALRRRRRSVIVRYASGQQVAVPQGATLLEASWLGGIPHASVCGGRGRCSTCRVRICDGLELLAPVQEPERRVLQRIGVPPNVRLACQTRPETSVEILPLLPPQQSASVPAGSRAAYTYGQERDIAVMFVDIRGFTGLAESRLPYDVVFILNRYVTDMGSAIEAAGGRIDKVIGDGIMALFGVDDSYASGCRASLDAARRMGENLRELNDSLANDLEQPLRIGVGIHGGSAIIGELGYRETRSLTAVGDTVNIASRLEAMTKEFATELVVSHAVADESGLDLAGFPSRQVTVRGRDDSLPVLLVDSLSALPGARDPQVARSRSRVAGHSS